ncbi:MAG: DUF3638 domain-containing protein [Puniceicoccales bacterium]|nr:DUF3638 domain-containing protein [Puniceicoccales bacterium]
MQPALTGAVSALMAQQVVSDTALLNDYRAKAADAGSAMAALSEVLVSANECLETGEDASAEVLLGHAIRIATLSGDKSMLDGVSEMPELDRNESAIEVDGKRYLVADKSDNLAFLRALLGTCIRRGAAVGAEQCKLSCGAVVDVAQNYHNTRAFIVRICHCIAQLFSSAAIAGFLLGKGDFSAKLVSSSEIFHKFLGINAKAKEKTKLSILGEKFATATKGQSKQPKGRSWHRSQMTEHGQAAFSAVGKLREPNKFGRGCPPVQLPDCVKKAYDFDGCVFKGNREELTGFLLKLGGRDNPNFAMDGELQLSSEDLHEAARMLYFELQNGDFMREIATREASDEKTKIATGFSYLLVTCLRVGKKQADNNSGTTDSYSRMLWDLFENGRLDENLGPLMDVPISFSNDTGFGVQHHRSSYRQICGKGSLDIKTAKKLFIEAISREDKRCAERVRPPKPILSDADHSAIVEMKSDRRKTATLAVKSFEGCAFAQHFNEPLKCVDLFFGNFKNYAADPRAVDLFCVLAKDFRNVDESNGGAPVSKKLLGIICECADEVSKGASECQDYGDRVLELAVALRMWRTIFGKDYGAGDEWAVAIRKIKHTLATWRVRNGQLSDSEAVMFCEYAALRSVRGGRPTVDDLIFALFIARNPNYGFMAASPKGGGSGGSIAGAIGATFGGGGVAKIINHLSGMAMSWRLKPEAKDIFEPAMDGFLENAYGGAIKMDWAAGILVDSNGNAIAAKKPEPAIIDDISLEGDRMVVLKDGKICADGCVLIDPKTGATTRKDGDGKTLVYVAMPQSGSSSVKYEGEFIDLCGKYVAFRNIDTGDTHFYCKWNMAKEVFWAHPTGHKRYKFFSHRNEEINVLRENDDFVFRTNVVGGDGASECIYCAGGGEKVLSLRLEVAPGSSEKRFWEYADGERTGRYAISQEDAAKFLPFEFGSDGQWLDRACGYGDVRSGGSVWLVDESAGTISACNSKLGDVISVTVEDGKISIPLFAGDASQLLPTNFISSIKFSLAQAKSEEELAGKMATMRQFIAAINGSGRAFPTEGPLMAMGRSAIGALNEVMASGRLASVSDETLVLAAQLFLEIGKIGSRGGMPSEVFGPNEDGMLNLVYRMNGNYSNCGIEDNKTSFKDAHDVIIGTCRQYANAAESLYVKLASVGGALRKDALEAMGGIAGTMAKTMPIDGKKTTAIVYPGGKRGGTVVMEGDEFPEKTVYISIGKDENKRVVARAKSLWQGRLNVVRRGKAKLALRLAFPGLRKGGARKQKLDGTVADVSVTVPGDDVELRKGTPHRTAAMTSGERFGDGGLDMARVGETALRELIGNADSADDSFEFSAFSSTPPPSEEKEADSDATTALAKLRKSLSEYGERKSVELTCHGDLFWRNLHDLIHGGASGRLLMVGRCANAVESLTADFAEVGAALSAERKKLEDAVLAVSGSIASRRVVGELQMPTFDSVASLWFRCVRSDGVTIDEKAFLAEYNKLYGDSLSLDGAKHVIGLMRNVLIVQTNLNACADRLNQAKKFSADVNAVVERLNAVDAAQLQQADEAALRESFGAFVQCIACGRSYDPTKSAFMLFFEHASKLRLSAEQVEVVKRAMDVAVGGSGSLAIQMMMGGGKTSVLISALVQFMSRRLVPIIASHHSQFHSATANIGAYQWTRFGQRTYAIPYDIGDVHNREVLENILATLLEADENHGCVSIPSATLRALRLSYLKQMCDLNSGDPDLPKIDEGTYACLSQINGFIAEKGLQICDESHLNLDTATTVNLGQGERADFKQQEKALFAKFFAAIWAKKDLANAIREGGGLSDELLLAAADAAIEKFDISNGESPAREEIRAFMVRKIAGGGEGKIAYESVLALRASDPGRFSKICLACGLLETLNYFSGKRFMEHYGYRTNNDGSIEVVPYNSANSPSEGNYANPLEAVVASYCANLQSASAGESYDNMHNTPVVRQIFKFLESSIKRPKSGGAVWIKNRYGDEWDKLLAVKSSKKDLVVLLEGLCRQIYVDYFDSKVDGEELCDLLRLINSDKFKYYNTSVESNCYSQLSTTKQTIACSGTAWNADLQGQGFCDEGARALDGDTPLRICSKLRADFADGKAVIFNLGTDVSDLTMTVQQVYGARVRRIDSAPRKDRALIDVAGVFRRKKNRDVALQLSKHFTVDSEIGGFAFVENNRWHVLKRDGVVVALDNSTEGEVFAKTGLSRDSLFVYFDQTHCTGEDFKLSVDGCAVETVDVNHTPNRSLQQGALRMRQLLSSQTVDICLVGDSTRKAEGADAGDAEKRNSVDAERFLALFAQTDEMQQGYVLENAYQCSAKEMRELLVQTVSKKVIALEKELSKCRKRFLSFGAKRAALRLRNATLCLRDLVYDKREFDPANWFGTDAQKMDPTEALRAVRDKHLQMIESHCGVGNDLCGEAKRATDAFVAAKENKFKSLGLGGVMVSSASCVESGTEVQAQSETQSEAEAEAEAETETEVETQSISNSRLRAIASDLAKASRARSETAIRQVASVGRISQNEFAMRTVDRNIFETIKALGVRASAVIGFAVKKMIDPYSIEDFLGGDHSKDPRFADLIAFLGDAGVHPREHSKTKIKVLLNKAFKVGSKSDNSTSARARSNELLNDRERERGAPDDYLGNLAAACDWSDRVSSETVEKIKKTKCYRLAAKRAEIFDTAKAKSREVTIARLFLFNVIDRFATSCASGEELLETFKTLDGFFDSGIVVGEIAKVLSAVVDGKLKPVEDQEEAGSPNANSKLTLSDVLGATRGDPFKVFDTIMRRLGGPGDILAKIADAKGGVKMPKDGIEGFIGKVLKFSLLRWGASAVTSLVAGKTSGIDMKSEHLSKSIPYLATVALNLARAIDPKATINPDKLLEALNKAGKGDSGDIINFSLAMIPIDRMTAEVKDRILKWISKDFNEFLGIFFEPADAGALAGIAKLALDKFIEPGGDSAKEFAASITECATATRTGDGGKGVKFVDVSAALGLVNEMVDGMQYMADRLGKDAKRNRIGVLRKGYDEAIQGLILLRSGEFVEGSVGNLMAARDAAADGIRRRLGAAFESIRNVPIASLYGDDKSKFDLLMAGAKVGKSADKCTIGDFVKCVRPVSLGGTIRGATLNDAVNYIVEVASKPDDGISEEEVARVKILKLCIEWAKAAYGSGADVAKKTERKSAKGAATTATTKSAHWASDEAFRGFMMKKPGDISGGLGEHELSTILESLKIKVEEKDVKVGDIFTYACGHTSGGSFNKKPRAPSLREAEAYIKKIKSDSTKDRSRHPERPLIAKLVDAYFADATRGAEVQPPTEGGGAGAEKADAVLTAAEEIDKLVSLAQQLASANLRMKEFSDKVNELGDGGSFSEEKAEAVGKPLETLLAKVNSLIVDPIKREMFKAGVQIALENGVSFGDFYVSLPGGPYGDSAVKADSLCWSLGEWIAARAEAGSIVGIDRLFGAVSASKSFSNPLEIVGGDGESMVTVGGKQVSIAAANDVLNDPTSQRALHCSHFLVYDERTAAEIKSNAAPRFKSLMLSDFEMERYSEVIRDGALAFAAIFDSDGKRVNGCSAPWERFSEDELRMDGRDDLAADVVSRRAHMDKMAVAAQRFALQVRAYNGDLDENGVRQLTFCSEGWSAMSKVQRESIVGLLQALVKNKAGQDACDAIDWDVILIPFEALGEAA